MKAATRNDKPRWIPAPAGITTAAVCRLSGKLASPGCEHAEVTTEDGSVERRSLVYSEYFAKGTVPTTTCDLHPTRTVVGALASLFDGDEPPPPKLEDTGAPAAPAAAVTADASVPPAVEPAAEPPPRRRGFWSRLFGLGSDRDRNANRPKEDATEPER
jgi:hypothetical protein